MHHSLRLQLIHPKRSYSIAYPSGFSDIFERSFSKFCRNERYGQSCAGMSRMQLLQRRKLTTAVNKKSTLKSSISSPGSLKTNCMSRNLIVAVLAASGCALIAVANESSITNEYHIMNNIGGPSMMPTINVSGDIYLAQYCAKSGGGINVQRGDIILFQDPTKSDEQRLLCKRVLALSGDIVHYFDNDEQDEDKPRSTVISDNFMWVEGDNPTWSIDSRTYGPVHNKLLRGKVISRLWPLNGSLVGIARDRPEVPQPLANGPMLRNGDMPSRRSHCVVVDV